MAAPIFKTKAEDTNPVFAQEDLSDFTSIPKLIRFSIIDFFYWWYIQRPIWYILSLRRIGTVLNDKLSISLLLKTFLTPWHRDYSFVGYFVGIIVRLLYLPIAIFILLTAISTYLVFIVVWFAIPLIAILLIVLSPFIRYT